MLRLFRESNTRRMCDLDGRWFYVADPDGINNWKDGLPAKKKSITIPGCFNTQLGMLNYEGNVWMETEFFTSLPHARLVFGAVNNDCDVYVDGRHLGHHWGPFTEFSFLVDNLTPGRHSLVLRVNNIHNDIDTIPLSNVDWFHYGGILHSVEVHEFNTTAVEAMKLEHTLEGTTAKLQAKLTLRAFQQVTEPVRLILDEQVLAEETVTLQGTTEITLTATLPNVKLWQQNDPVLYTFTAQFGADTLCDRTGFRTIEIKDGKFLLNGTPIFFKGVNRHEEHPDWGFAVPAKLAQRDIDIIRDMGCNFIRGSHYPNAKSTLDYMDESGILFWEEIPMWGFQEEALSNATVRERGVYLHSEMVRRDYNHPCIVVWGLNNEVDTSTQAAWEVAKLFRETIEKQDITRLITFASNRGAIDICYEFADFVSVNNYTAWYSKDGLTLPDWKVYLSKLFAYMESTGNGHKPVVISEFGAGGIYNTRELEEGLYWTENYQQEYLEYTLNLFMNEERIQGALVWQFADIRSGTRSNDNGIRRLLARPRSFNNKGLLNEFRRPKMAYYAVKKLFTLK